MLYCFILGGNTKRIIKDTYQTLNLDRSDTIIIIKAEKERLPELPNYTHQKISEKINRPFILIANGGTTELQTAVIMNNLSNMKAIYNVQYGNAVCLWRLYRDLHTSEKRIIKRFEAGMAF